MGRDGPRGRKVLHRQIFVVGYLQFVDSKKLHTALRSTGYGTSAVTGGCPFAASLHP